MEYPNEYESFLIHKLGRMSSRQKLIKVDSDFDIIHMKFLGSRLRFSKRGEKERNFSMRRDCIMIFFFNIIY